VSARAAYVREGDHCGSPLLFRNHSGFRLSPDYPSAACQVQCHSEPRSAKNRGQSRTRTVRRPDDRRFFALRGSVGCQGLSVWLHLTLSSSRAEPRDLGYWSSTEILRQAQDDGTRKAGFDSLLSSATIVHCRISPVILSTSKLTASLNRWRGCVIEDPPAKPVAASIRANRGHDHRQVPPDSGGSLASSG
jgi:hypothetical protein